MKIQFTQDIDDPVYKDALTIRKTVFVQEQHVPVTIEVDQDEDKCFHIVLYHQNKAYATCRLLPLENKLKLQRMAVLKEARKKGYGKQVILFAEKLAKKQGFTKILLGAQVSAVPFYEKMDYQKYGEKFLDAAIWHYMMEKKL